jgi:hypothetical protein
MRALAGALELAAGALAGALERATERVGSTVADPTSFRDSLNQSKHLATNDGSPRACKVGPGRERLFAFAA